MRTSLPGNPLAPGCGAPLRTGCSRRVGRARPAHHVRRRRPARRRRRGRSQRTRHERRGPRGHQRRAAVPPRTGHPDDLEGASAPAALVIEVSDHHPARAVRSDRDADRAAGTPEYGRGLRLVAALSDAWGITYRTGPKTVWARLPVDGRRPRAATPRRRTPAQGAAARAARRRDPGSAPPRRFRRRTTDWVSRGALSFLAEASDLLAGQLDEDLVAALAGQLLVPRLADWCAVWLDDEDGRPGRGPPTAWAAAPAPCSPASPASGTPARTASRSCARSWRRTPPQPSDAARSAARPRALARRGRGARPGRAPRSPTASAAGGAPLGTLLIGRAGLTRFPDEVTGARRGLRPPRRPRRQRRPPATPGRPPSAASSSADCCPARSPRSPACETALVYEPRDEGVARRRLLRPLPGRRRPLVLRARRRPGQRPRGRRRHRPRPALAAAAGPRGLPGRRGPRPAQPAPPRRRDGGRRRGGPRRSPPRAARASPGEGPQTRFLSLLYGELVPFGGRGALHPRHRRTPAAAAAAARRRGAHGAPSRRCSSGSSRTPRTPARPSTCAPGDTLLCVTDGVTERRYGTRQFDDERRPRPAPSPAARGSTRRAVAERIRRLVHEFAARARRTDDLALLVLQARVEASTAAAGGLLRGAGQWGHAFRTARRRARARRRRAARVRARRARPTGRSGSTCTCRTARPAAATATSTPTPRPSCAAPAACSPPATTTPRPSPTRSGWPARCSATTRGRSRRSSSAAARRRCWPPATSCGCSGAIRDEFGLAADAEITTEANPESVDPAYLAALREGGFNRISFGMQSARQHVLKVLDRTHTPGRPRGVRRGGARRRASST